MRGKVVGQIEYAAPYASGYPVRGKNILVVNCIWLLRKAEGHRFGRYLMEVMWRARM